MNKMKIPIITVLQTFVLVNPMKKPISVPDIDFTHPLTGKKNLTQNQNQYKKKHRGKTIGLTGCFSIK